MAILDVFNSDAFSAISLSSAIQRLKVDYGLLQQMGIFAEQGVDTTSVALEEQSDVLNLLTSKPRGSEPTLNTTGKRKVHSMNVPHNPIVDRVLPSDVQNIRAFGSESSMEAVADKVAFKLESMRRKLAITREYRRWKALEGTIVDADGATLLNLFTLLGKTRKEVDFVLGTAGTNIVAKIEEVLDHIEENAEGEMVSGYVAFCGKTFWDKLTNHSKVSEAWKNWDGRSNMLGIDKRTGFFFGGVTWIKHIGNAPYVDSTGASTTRAFVPDGDALILPQGTTSTFVGVNAPADMAAAVNTIGQAYYASSELLPHGKGVEIYAEANYLPYVTRPQLVVRAHSSN
jgi:hypothetical protein